MCGRTGSAERMRRVSGVWGVGAGDTRRGSAVHCAAANPKHATMFVVDMGVERKVKLQAATERERDAWVAAIEAAKLRAWAAQEQTAFDGVRQGGPQQGDLAGGARSEHPRADTSDDPASRSVDDIHLIPDDMAKAHCCVLL